METGFLVVGSMSALNGFDISSFSYYVPTLCGIWACWVCSSSRRPSLPHETNRHGAYVVRSTPSHVPSHIIVPTVSLDFVGMGGA